VGDPNRLCKHLRQVALDAARKGDDPLSLPITALLEEYYEADHFFADKETGTIVSFSQGQEWVNFYPGASLNEERERYGYSVKHGRWSYNAIPENADLFEEIAESLPIQKA
jgi:hypothetical protein